jgi:hypothetical protein
MNGFAMQRLPANELVKQYTDRHKWDIDEYNKIYNNFSDDFEEIENYLAELGNAELHFFWTTGRLISNNLEYGSDNDADVGGLKFLAFHHRQVFSKILPNVKHCISNAEILHRN